MTEMSTSRPTIIRADSPLANLLTPSQVADLLHVRMATLSAWRCRHKYRLPYVKVGSRVMYPLDSVEAFLRDRTRGAQKEV